MKLPFTVDQFFAVFAGYNLAVWPAQVALIALAALAVVLLLRRPTRASRLISAILAVLWAWTGVVYHLAFFASVNPAARFFALLFVGQAAVFLFAGVLHTRLEFERGSGLRRGAGWGLVAYALGGYPLLGWLAGHRYPAIPTFGAPCPTTILTLGILLFARRPPSFWIALVPLLWAVVGTSAAVALDVPQDVGLAIAGAAVLFDLAARRGGAARTA